MPSLLRRIDELLRPDHWYLEPSDLGFFLREYTKGGGYQASETNQLILNLKKSPSLRGTSQWKYKGIAIRRCANELKSALAKYLDGWTIVPIPPSKARDDPEYDDRLCQVGQILCAETSARFCELIVQRTTTPADHLQDSARRTPDLIAANYWIDEALAAPEPTHVWIIDDVLTTGAHFKAVQQVLLQRFPVAKVCGVFIARRAPLPDEPPVNG